MLNMPACPAATVSLTSADGQPGKRLAEAARLRLLDEHLQLIHAHLHPLAEIIGDDDPPLRRGLLVDKQFRAAATALAAQQDEPGKTPGTVIHFRAPFDPYRESRSLTEVEHHAPYRISQRESKN